ncbi:MAG TPA: chromophore lyase CpcT/CpeT [Steroidobacteraceae bacterium]|nr:chromophore lyase CpcT/CpeT [Steroidobacteraceae bacterium]
MARDSWMFRWSRGAAVALAALALAATVFAKPKKEDVFLAQLAAMLAGSYDNIAQARRDADHPGLRLMIVPVQAPLVGDNVFYVQEMASDDLRRVFSQKLWVLNVIPKREQAVLAQLDLKEPLRWRDGQNNRDLFRSMLMQDLRARPGCDLLWQRDGEGFKAALQANACRTASRATGETLKVDLRMQLGADTLNVFEQQRDATGALVSGDLPDPWLRYARRGDAPW